MLYCYSFSTLLYDMPLGESQKSQMDWIKLNGRHQLLVFADDVNLLRNNIATLKKNTETLTDAS
jgi:hypothetical protein